MARIPEGIDLTDLTVAAREVLLDALQALREHQEAVVLVGAQAVYVHAGHAQLGVVAYTSDGDLGIDPARLGETPLIEKAMSEAGFTRSHASEAQQPGIWWKSARVDGRTLPIEVDLLVPAELADGSSSRRSVAVGPHDRQALRRVDGLAVAMEDNAVHSVVALAPGDGRRLDVRVAGIAALLVAKGFKLGERLSNPNRLNDKDAADVFSLMATADYGQTAATFQTLLNNERVAESAAQGLRYLRQLFAEENSPGVEMARRALTGFPEADLVSAVAPAFMAQLPTV